jgi:hypothetical protein
VVRGRSCEPRERRDSLIGSWPPRVDRPYRHRPLATFRLVV